MALYIALGDSITAGESVTRPQLAYPSLVVSLLCNARQNHGYECEVLAVPGWTSYNLYAAVEENSPYYLSSASAITIWVGGDDLASGALAADSTKNYKNLTKAIQMYKGELTKLIRRIHFISKAPIIVCTQYNPFPNTPIASTGIGLLNHTTLSICQSERVGIAPVHTWFEGRQPELIAGYQHGRIEDVFKSSMLPIHPNDRGHAVIAHGLFPLIQTAMVKTAHL